VVYSEVVVTCLYRSKLCPSCEIPFQQALLLGPGPPPSDMRASFPREAGKSKGQQLTEHPHHNLSNISTTPPPNSSQKSLPMHFTPSPWRRRFLEITNTRQC